MAKIIVEPQLDQCVFEFKSNTDRDVICKIPIVIRFQEVAPLSIYNRFWKDLFNEFNQKENTPENSPELKVLENNPAEKLKMGNTGFSVFSEIPLNLIEMNPNVIGAILTDHMESIMSSQVVSNMELLLDRISRAKKQLQKTLSTSNSD